VREYTGIAAFSVPDPKAEDFTPRLRNMLSTIDIFLRDASFGFARIQAGQAPSGSGTPIASPPDLSDYLKLSGRSGGQTIASTASSDNVLSIQSTAVPSGDFFRVLDSSGGILARLKATSQIQMGSDVDNAIYGARGITEIQNASTTAYVLQAYAALRLTTNLSGTTSIYVASTGSGSGITSAVSFGAYVRANMSGSTAAGLLVGNIGSGTGPLIACASPENTIVAKVTNAGAFNGTGLQLNGSTSGTLTLAPVATSPTLSGQPLLVGNTTSAAGVLGSSNLTAQTVSIGSTTLLTGAADTAGMFRVSAYVKTTTAGNPADVVKMTVSWNDGAAQTLDMPFESATVIFNNHDLATNNAHSQGSIVLNVAASQNITYTTTVTKTGSPQYEIHVRIEALG
jgi:hypothetical protein